MSLPTFEAQLAGQHGDLAAACRNPGRFAVEEKFDGIRALIAIEGERVTVLNRYGENKGRAANITSVESALRALIAAVPMLKAGTILDGELVAGTWNETMHLLGSAGKGSTGLRFVAFDLPFLAGTDLRSQPWEARRKALVALMSAAAEPLAVSAVLDATPTSAEAIWARGGEGLIIKDRQATYRPGDRKAWTKVKKVESTEAVVIGFEPGAAHGTILLGQYAKDGSLVRVASCKRQHAGDGKVGDVVEFTFIGRMGASYRHPQFLRVRTDKPAALCTVE
jgi:bifunctional non-homologous end joining protein LigD